MRSKVLLTNHSFVICCVVSSFIACAGREAAWNSTTGSASNAMPAATRQRATVLANEAAGLWKKRLDRVSVAAAIAKLEESTALDPTVAPRWERLARAHYFFADAHLAPTYLDEKEKGDGDESQRGRALRKELLRFYERGIAAAERALVALSPDFRSRVQAGARIERALDILPRAAAGALYWYAANLGRWALLKGIAELLFHKDRVFQVIRHIQSVAPKFFFGAADRYFGVYYTRVPIPGGDLPRSRQHFERVLREHPTYFASRVLFAEYYAVRVRDRALFERTLRDVLNADETNLLNYVPEQTVEKRRAKLLLEKVEDLF